MKLDRRDFIRSSLVASATVLAGAKTSAAETDAPVLAGREYFELRAYRLKPGAAHTLLDGYLEKALIPALNLRGIKAVGVFTEPEAKDGPAVWVLIPHPSLESVASVTALLNTDPTVQSAAAEYFASSTKDAPAFERIDTWLLLAFAGQPQLAIPALRREDKARIFELRVYESYSEAKALNKVAMFNAGEIDVMQQLGMSPVFFGQALVGRDLPRLTYMLCSPDRETHARNWKAFFDHPVWTKLKNDPHYADNVSKVVSRFLIPTGYSQI